MQLSSKYRILWSVTIGFGLVASLLGLALRYYFVQPLAFNFSFVLHAHSHLMLLGWLFNALLLLIYQAWFEDIPKVHYRLFLALQVCVFGMLCSFPFQGYAFFSILFSTLHIWVSYALLWKLWKYGRNKHLEGWLVRAGIVFHFLSTIGPYALGPIIANDLRGSDWYDQAIYFYLHFQYNGSFFFFLLALIWHYWKKDEAVMSTKTFLWILTAGVILTWAHSLEYSFHSAWVYTAAMAGSLLQLSAGIMIFKNLDRHKVNRNGLLILSFLALKWLFQLPGSTPDTAVWVSQNRFLLIAYLHFIFLGIYTPFIWERLFTASAAFLKNLYWLFFILTEILLVLFGAGNIASSRPGMILLFTLYAALVLCWSGLAVKWRTNSHQ